MFYKLCQTSTHAVVTSVEITEKKKTRPIPLNTVELLKVCSRQLGIGPADAMKIAEHVSGLFENNK